MLVLGRVQVSFERLSENHFFSLVHPECCQATKSKINHVSVQQLPGHINSMRKAVGIFGESMLGPTCYKTQTRRKNKTLVKLEVTNNLWKGSLNHPKKSTKNYQVITLQGTNISDISHQKSLLKMVGYVSSLESYICNGLQSSFIDSMFEVTTPGWKTRTKTAPTYMALQFPWKVDRKSVAHKLPQPTGWWYRKPLWQINWYGSWQFCDRDLFGMVNFRDPFKWLSDLQRSGMKRSHWITWVKLSGGCLGFLNHQQ